MDEENAHAYAHAFEKLKQLRFCSDPHYLRKVDSTSTWLKRKIETASFARFPDLAVTDLQTAGRGQREKVWLFGDGNFAASYFWSQDNLPLANQSLIGLFTGVVVADSLAELGVPDVKLKWPNDIWIGESKIGGILVESTSVGQISTVKTPGWCVGIGINLCWPEVERKAADGASVNSIRSLARMTITPSDYLVQFADHWIQSLNRLRDSGSGDWLGRFRRRCILTNRIVELQRGDECFHACVRGIANDGALLVQRLPHDSLRSDRDVESVHSGSIRMLSEENDSTREQQI